MSIICTCVWSPVNTTTIDPPRIVARDPNCPRHGDEVDDGYARDEKHAQRRRDADEGFEE